MKRFECPRCFRRYDDAEQNWEIECICHMDCEYCGKLQTVTTIYTPTKMTPKYDSEPMYSKHVHPDPWRETHGPCTNCGHYQGRPIVYAVPIGEDAEYDLWKRGVTR